MNASDRLSTTIWLWLLAAVVSFLVATIATDSDGRKSYDHVAAVPASVVQLSGTSYLVKNGSTVSPSYICLQGPGDQGGQQIRTTRVLPQLGATFVECGAGQTWSDHRKLSLDFGGAAVYVLTSPSWFVPLSGLLVFPMLLWVLPGYVGERRELARRAKQRAIDAKAKRDETEEKRSALAAAFARGEIEEPEFEKALDRVMRGIDR